MYKQIRESKYEISDKGEIRNRETGQELKQQNHNGYKTVKINIGDGEKKYRVHRLVGEVFIPNPKNLPEINHKDLNKANNEVSNLEWCSREENIKHAQINNPMCEPSKSVIEVDIETKEMKVYKSLYEAAKSELGRFAKEKEIDSVSIMISKCCKGQQKVHNGKYYFFNIGDNINRIEELIEERQKYTKEQRELIEKNNLDTSTIRYRTKVLGMNLEEALKYKKGYKFRVPESIYKSDSKLVQGVGKRFGKLTVLEYIREKGKKATYRCKCDCGNEIITQYTNLWVGKVKSCGCLSKTRERM